MGNMDMNEIDHFMPILMKREEEAEMTPMVSHGSSHFLWIKHSNLYCIHLSSCLNTGVLCVCRKPSLYCPDWSLNLNLFTIFFFPSINTVNSQHLFIDLNSVFN